MIQGLYWKIFDHFNECYFENSFIEEGRSTAAPEIWNFMVDSMFYSECCIKLFVPGLNICNCFHEFL